MRASRSDDEDEEEEEDMEAESDDAEREELEREEQALLGNILNGPNPQVCVCVCVCVCLTVCLVFISSALKSKKTNYVCLPQKQDTNTHTKPVLEAKENTHRQAQKS